jgi:hypothetical protein
MNQKDGIARITFRILVGSIALVILIFLISSWSKLDNIPYEMVVFFVLFFGYAIGGNELAGYLLNLIGINLSRHIKEIDENDASDNDKTNSKKQSIHSKPFSYKITIIGFIIIALLMCL